MTTASPLLTVSEVARRLAVHPETIRRWIVAGQLPSLRTPTGQYRVRESDLSAAVELVVPADKT